MERRWGNTRLILYTILILAMLLAVWEIVRLGQPLERRHSSVGPIPITLFVPRNAEGPRPTVVLAHGFANSRQFMYTFAYTLARNGYVVASLDFSGHGANPIPLATVQSSTGSAGQLDSDLAAVVSYVKQLPEADPERLALVGFSMGSAVVSRYAMTHDDIQATVAVSSVYPGVEPGRPRNLLLVTGAWEQARLMENARAALAARGGSEVGVTSGNLADGTGTRLVFAPRAEHILAPFSSVTQAETLAWLNATFGESGQGGVDSRMPWLLVLYAGAFFLFAPVATLLFGEEEESTATSPLEIWGVLVVAGVPALLTPLALRVLPYGFLPLSGGDYIASFFLLQGLAMGGLLLGLNAWDRATVARLLSRRALWFALLLFAYLALLWGLPTQAQLMNVAPIPRRLGIIAVTLLAVLPYFAASEFISRTSYPGYNQLFPLITRGLLLLSFGLGIVLGAPFVMVLLLPALVAMLLLTELLNRTIYRLSRNPGASALFSALLVAWLIGAVFPLI